VTGTHHHVGGLPLEIIASGVDKAPARPPTPENLPAVVAGELFIRPSERDGGRSQDRERA
jgi:hypothetical protein